MDWRKAFRHVAVARVSGLIMKAEAIWIAVGDQSDRTDQWKGTAVQAAINARIAAGVPVGGTGAGLNVLCQFVYLAQASKGVTSGRIRAGGRPSSRQPALLTLVISGAILSIVAGP